MTMTEEEQETSNVSSPPEAEDGKVDEAAAEIEGPSVRWYRFNNVKMAQDQYGRFLVLECNIDLPASLRFLCFKIVSSLTPSTS